MRTPDRPRRRALAGALAALVLTGCTDGAAAPAPDASPEPTVRQYVALGDSFTAAPYVPRTDLAGGCLRSSGNYPALVADELGAALTDVSCSGAESADLTRPQPVGLGGSTVPPQVEALAEDTDLVTVGIGGNDSDLFATLVYRCTAVAGQPGAPCSALLEDALGEPATVVAGTGRRVAAALRAVRRAAPEATVVVVGYPRLVQADRGCPAMPLAAGDLPELVALEEELNDALAAAADRAGALFADLRPVTAGHEICSPDPWVNGRRTDQRRALAYHPFAEGQRAAADAVLATLAAAEDG